MFGSSEHEPLTANKGQILKIKYIYFACNLSEAVKYHANKW